MNAQVVGERQVLELPRILDSQSQMFGRRCDGPGRDTQSQQDMLEREAGCAMGEPRRRVVVHEDEAHLLVGGEATPGERAPSRRVVRALSHQVVVLVETEMLLVSLFLPPSVVRIIRVVVVVVVTLSLDDF